MAIKVLNNQKTGLVFPKAAPLNGPNISCPSLVTLGQNVKSANCPKVEMHGPKMV